MSRYSAMLIASTLPFARVRLSFAILALAFFIFIISAHSISAATYTVTTIADAGAGSLRQAVLDANATAADDTIVFNIPSASCNATTGVCTITLASEITITNNGSLTINGTGANRLTIDGGAGTNRIFYSDAATFTLRGATLTGGNGTGARTDFNNHGGAILVIGGTMTIGGVYFTGNSTSESGGAASFYSANHRIENSTFSNNTAGLQGGAIEANSGTTTIVNSTITGNSVNSLYGGAISEAYGTLTLRGVTIAGNSLTGNNPFNGGGIFVQGGATLDFSNSIIAGNTTGSGNAPDIKNSGSTVTSSGYNIVGNNDGTNLVAGNPNVNNDFVGQPGSAINPQLAPLAFNGGTTPTRALCTAAGVPDAACSGASPAIDKGSAVAGVFSDGRGVIRPYDIFTTANAAGGNGADIGAFELIPTSEFGWGFNGSGQIGDGTTTDRSLPTQIAGGFTDIVGVEGGSNHVIGLRSNGTLLAWGSNGSGQLGDGTTTNNSSPVAVIGLTNVVAVAGGGNHCLALLADGTVMAWGSNINGQLGNQLGASSTPVVVGGITNAVAVAAVANTSYALLADGSVVAWGRNSSGQLGDGTTTPRSTPGQVSGLTGGVVAIDGGGNSVYALLSDGSVRAWGNNANGQLGDGTTTNRLTPVTPLNLTSGVVQIAGGFFYAAALKADGTLLTWGANDSGQLGNGTTTSSSTPTAISLANVTQIKASIGTDTYARLRDGSLYAWGANSNGQVGNGTTASAQTTPVRVSTDAGIGFFGAYASGGYAGSPLASVSTGAQFVRLGDATVNFLNVATAGTLQIRTFDPLTTGLTVPAGYTIEANSTGYDITSTAQFTGNAQVCLKTSNVIDQTTFSKLTILHDDNFDGTLDAVSVTKNYQKREVCRVTQSFSPFVLAQALAPTAANVSVGGRVTVGKGSGLRNATVQIILANGESRTTRTGTFGYYRFDGIQAGQTVIVSVISKKYSFAPQIVSVAEDLTELDFIAIE